MATKTRNKLKDYFSTGKYPDGEQFADLIDSFRHKEEDRIESGEIPGLDAQLGKMRCVLDIGEFASKDAACAYAANSEVAGNRSVALIIFRATGMTGTLLDGRIFQMVNGQDVAMQYLMWDKRLWRRNVTGATGVAGAATNAYGWEQSGAHSLVYDAARRRLAVRSYERDELSVVTLPQATTSAAGLMSAADKTAVVSMAEKIAALEAKIAALEQVREESAE